jgi:predicted RNA-binding Zn-ribbon protein involved in translation (DUF1610 family)
MSPSQLQCRSCGYSWLPRGTNYSLGCPECGATVADESAAKPSGLRYLMYFLVFLVIGGVIIGIGILRPLANRQAELPPPPPPVSPDQKVAEAPVAPAISHPPPQGKPVPDQDAASVPPDTPLSDEAAKLEESRKKAQAAITDAARKLSLAKVFVKSGDKPTARRRLREIIDNFGETPSADDARLLLKQVE